MKSSVQKLRSRGMAADDDIARAAKLSSETLSGMLDFPDAAVRTAAVKVLSGRHGGDDSILRLFIARLEKERNLYTKIALCNALAHGGAAAARLIVPYAGKIGANQYKTLPTRVSHKKCYPLPRDIIARTLGVMSPVIAPVLSKALLNKNCAISEIVDAFGYLVSKKPMLGTAQNAAVIETVLREHRRNDLVVWKCAVALSAFSCEHGGVLLENLLNSNYPPIIKAEAQRSLSMHAATKKT